MISESAQVINSKYAWSGLVRTVNGGRTWEIVHFQQRALDLLGIDEDEDVRTYFVTPTTGWLINDSATWKTTNGGLKWSRISRDDLSAIAFANPKQGWMQVWHASSRDFAFAKTGDGGRTWNTCSNSSTFSIPFSDPPYFITATDLAAVVIRDWPSTPLYAASQDGGCSWALHTIPDKMFDHFATPYFLTANCGWLPGAYLGTLITTNDGGVTWKSVVVTIHEANKFLKPAAILSVYFATESHGWVLAYDRTGEFPIYTTLNSGKTWNRETAVELVHDYHQLDKHSPRLWDVFTIAAVLNEDKMGRRHE